MAAINLSLGMLICSCDPVKLASAPFCASSCSRECASLEIGLELTFSTKPIVLRLNTSSRQIEYLLYKTVNVHLHQLLLSFPLPGDRHNSSVSLHRNPSRDKVSLLVHIKDIGDDRLDLDLILKFLIVHVVSFQCWLLRLSKILGCHFKVGFERKFEILQKVLGINLSYIRRLVSSISHSVSNSLHNHHLPIELKTQLITCQFDFAFRVARNHLQNLLRAMAMSAKDLQIEAEKCEPEKLQLLEVTKERVSALETLLQDIYDRRHPTLDDYAM
ncbi:hypothetical protein ACS0TY_005656 [Phlomoides rotata]